MIKVVYLPLNCGDVVQSGCYDAFKDAGCHLEVFDFYNKYEACGKNAHRVRTEFTAFVNTVKPDLLHMQLQHTDVIDVESIRAVKRINPKMIISNWTGDVRNYVPPTFKTISQVCDYNLISSTGQIPMFEKETGKEIKFWQIGYNPKLYYPPVSTPTTFAYDLIFIGNDNARENYPGRTDRLRALEVLRHHLGDRFALFGSNWPKNLKSLGSIDQKTVAKEYHKSFASLSVSHYNDINHYFSDRLLMCMACGRPVISYRFPKYESYFTNNCDLFMVDSIQDIVPKLRHLMANRELAEYVAMSGSYKVKSEQTYYCRINELLKIVKLR